MLVPEGLIGAGPRGGCGRLFTRSLFVFWRCASVRSARDHRKPAPAPAEPDASMIVQIRALGARTKARRRALVRIRAFAPWPSMGALGSDLHHIPCFGLFSSWWARRAKHGPIASRAHHAMVPSTGGLLDRPLMETTDGEPAPEQTPLTYPQGPRSRRENGNTFFFNTGVVCA